MDLKEKSRLVLVDKKMMEHESGHLWSCLLSKHLPTGDSMQNPRVSQVILYEDGEELGPPHITTDMIRDHGSGRYSHWLDKLYFSSSDNSSPKKNKRRYEILFPAAMFVPDLDPISAAVINFQPETLPLLDRYELAKSLFRRAWRNTPLPDWGRKIETDKLFNDTFSSVCADNDASIERKYNLVQIFQLIMKVNGDVAECGTYKGASAKFLAQQIVKHNLNKQLCLFDSFEGLSKPEDIDGIYWTKADLKCDVSDVENTLAKFASAPFIEIYDGWIPERFNEIADRAFCFVHIDVDLYQPTKDSIAFFYPRMSPGGIILLDDYGFESCPGVTECIDNFMADKPEPIINLASGGAFIIKETA